MTCQHADELAAVWPRRSSRHAP